VNNTYSGSDEPGTEYINCTVEVPYEYNNNTNSTYGSGSENTVSVPYTDGNDSATYTTTTYETGTVPSIQQ
jgi:hypothetical protein